MYAAGDGWVQAQPQYAYGQLPAFGQVTPQAYAVQPAWGAYATQPAAYAQPGAVYQCDPTATYQATAYVQSAVPQPMAQQYDPVDLFMQELGIDPDEVVYFGWIADYGLQSDVLPEPWTAHTDPSTGRIFYADSVSGQTSWENPVADLLRTSIEIGRLFLQSPSETHFDDHMQRIWDQHKRELDAWHGPMMDAEGNQYYINSSTAESSRQDPRISTQYVWELEKTVLESLRDTLVAPDQPDELPNLGLTDEELLERLASPPETSCLEEDNGETGWENTGTSRTSPLTVRKTMLQVARERTELAGRVNPADYRSAFKKMTETLNGMDYSIKDEAEVQRLLMKRKMLERKERKRQLEKEEYERKFGEEWERSLAAMERQKRDDEVRKKALADAEEARKAEEFRQRQEEERRAEEERRIQEEERKAAEEERQRVLAEKVAQLEEEKRLKEEAKLQELAKKAAEEEAERKREEARKAREDLIIRLRQAAQSRSIHALRTAIAEAEAAGLTHELDPLKKALEEEICRSKAAALKARKAAEKLASDFKSAKEAQDCGGATLAAQWRAAVKEVAKPYDENQPLGG